MNAIACSILASAALICAAELEIHGLNSTWVKGCCLGAFIMLASVLLGKS